MINAIFKQALDINRHDAWSTHAIEMTGRQKEGIAFMKNTENDWKVCFIYYKHKHIGCLHDYWKLLQHDQVDTLTFIDLAIFFL